MKNAVKAIDSRSGTDPSQIMTSEEEGNERCSPEERLGNSRWHACKPQARVLQDFYWRSRMREQALPRKQKRLHEFTAGFRLFPARPSRFAVCPESGWDYRLPSRTGISPLASAGVIKFPVVNEVQSPDGRNIELVSGRIYSGSQVNGSTFLRSSCRDWLCTRDTHRANGTRGCSIITKIAHYIRGPSSSWSAACGRDGSGLPYNVHLRARL